MGPILFAKALLTGRIIKIFNQGQVQRDFTYVDDVVKGVVRCLDRPAPADPNCGPFNPNRATAAGPHRLCNIGNSQPT